MEVFECIQNRYSYRGAYKNIPVNRDDLEKIIEEVSRENNLNSQWLNDTSDRNPSSLFQEDGFISFIHYIVVRQSLAINCLQ